MQKVIIPLNAFNRMEVLEKGQASFIKLIAESGAYGIEIRRELFSNQDPTLVSMKQEMEQHQLFTVYSAPIELWKEDHQLNEQELTTIFQEGKQLGAKWIKVSLGHFDKSQSSVSNLHSFLRQHPEIQLFVENDQTLHGGNITNLQSFFESATEENAPVKMTFDAGNWYYSKQYVREALTQLSQYVHYLHLKQVDQENGELVTLPLRKNIGHSWEMVMNSLPNGLVKALEFPIEPKERTKEYIQMMTESEALL
ncbi:sugar phosphate isomerase/epimerase [Neobacillus sp. YX16]|uniref:sugar phosphate isomerase/epimerase family protein n=1 Tax=Neobacillus sp. YX16 TaxID=3047874 RepID=UPI0024C2E8A9|nr:sugar phosphate isomerase/epimerase [Neobacillus sp. YX16]WHZ02554.1 sugar phosphate isomerase/epimerase [Neobacillus sp. YX16]